MTRLSCGPAVAAFVLLNGPVALGQSLDPVISALAAARAALPPVRAHVTVAVERTPAYYRMLHVPHQAPEAATTVCDWAADRGKLFYSWTEGTQPSTKVPVFHHSEIFDGERAFDVDKSTGITIGENERVWEHGSICRSPMDFGYMYRGQWYDRVIRDGAFRIARTAPDARRPNMTVLTGYTASGDQLNLFIDLRRGGMVVRAEESHPDGDLSVLAAASAQRIQGAWLPMIGTYTWSRPDAGRQVVLEREQYALKDVTVGSVPDSLFSPPRLTPGAVITSESDGKIYKVGSAGELIPAGRVGYHGQPPPGTRFSGWIFLMSVAGLIFTLMLRLQRIRGRESGDATDDTHADD